MMHSKRYDDAKKEFWNCIWLSPVGLFVPLWNAFKIWKPIMDEELSLERKNNASGIQADS
mgnify:CR=1 FL=1